MLDVAVAPPLFAALDLLRKMKRTEPSLIEVKIQNRISRLENAISKAQGYLQNGDNASWHGFKPFFVEKIKNGKVLPPHKDWVKNVFIPGKEKAIKEAEETLEKLKWKK